jgi:hypothetical protein
MRHTTRTGTIPNLGWLAKYLSFAKYSSMQGLFISQLHNCQLGPFDGLALGMAHGNQPPKHTSINQ